MQRTVRRAMAAMQHEQLKKRKVTNHKVASEHRQSKWNKIPKRHPPTAFGPKKAEIGTSIHQH